MGETWIPVVGSVLASLLGTGGLAGFLNWRLSKRLGIRQEDRADDDSLSKRAQEMLRTQFEVFVQPLQKEVESLRVEVRDVKAQLHSQQNRYWRLAAYTRRLRDWVAQHVTDQNPPPPQPHPDLLDDLAQ